MIAPLGGTLMRANSKVSRLLIPTGIAALLFTLFLNTFVERTWGHASEAELNNVDALNLRPGPPGPMTLGPDERLITILQTNDIHGGVEPQPLVQDPHAPPVGGMPLWVGIVQATRKGLQRQFGERAGVLLLDGGDQFQGR
jgi:2',3'-cyclic-nucleotide 2'-phosphodiesterase (5'-nucleotidase family)